MATNAVNVIMTLVAVRQFASVQSAQLQTFKKFSSVYCRVNEKIKVSKSISFHAANARLQNGWNTYPVIGEEQRSVIIIHRRRRSWLMRASGWDWQTHHHSYRRHQRNNLLIPASSRSSPAGVCGLLPEHHDHWVRRRCNHIKLLTSIFPPTGYVLDCWWTLKQQQQQQQQQHDNINNGHDFQLHACAGWHTDRQKERRSAVPAT